MVVAGVLWYVSHLANRSGGVMRYTFEATLWKVPGESAWHFVTLPFEAADEIEQLTAETRRGFGSVRVHARIGGTRFDTSLFPDTKAESYVLPVKAQVRKAEHITDGDAIDVSIELAEAPPGGIR
jgi:hypothetical protein